MKALADEDGLVRYFASLGLGDSGKTELIPELLTAHENEKDAFVRLWMGVQLVKLGESSKSYNVFLDIREVDKLGNEEWDNAILIVHSIARLGESCIPQMIINLTDSNETVRWISVMVLNEIRSKSAIDPLKKLLEYEESEIVIQNTFWIDEVDPECLQTRSCILGLINLIASKEEQIQYEKTVPFVSIVPELISLWFDVHDQVGDLWKDRCFNTEEQLGIREFALFFKKHIDRFPFDKSLRQYHRHRTWKGIMRKAKETSEKLGFDHYQAWG